MLIWMSATAAIKANQGNKKHPFFLEEKLRMFQFFLGNFWHADKVLSNSPLYQFHLEKPVVCYQKAKESKQDRSWEVSLTRKSR